MEFTNEALRQKQISLEKQKEERENDMNEKDLTLHKHIQKLHEKERDFNVLSQKYRSLN